MPEINPEFQNLADDLKDDLKERPVLETDDEESAKERTAEEQKRVMDEIALISRIFSRQYDVDVLPSNKWACGLDPETNHILDKFMSGEIADIDTIEEKVFKPTVIMYDRKSLVREGRDEIIGKTRHEVGHAKHSDYRLLVKGMKQAKDEGYSTTSWGMISNAIEDPWVNNLESKGSDTVRNKIETLYKQWKRDTIHHIGTQTPTRQLGLNIIHHWLTGQNIPTLKNESVLKVFEDIKPSVEKMFEAETAQENFDTLKNEVWEKFKPLIEKSKEEEQMKQMMDSAAGDLMDKLKNQEGSEKNESQQDQESEDASMLQKLRNKLFGKPGKNKEEQELSDELNGQLDEETKQEIRKQLQDQINKREAEAEQNESTDADSSDEHRVPANDVNMDDIPEDLKEKLKEAIDALPPDIKDKLQKEAEEELEKKEAKSLNQDLPSYLKMKKDKETGDYRPQFETKPESEISETKKEVDQLAQQQEEQENEQRKQQQASHEQKEQKRKADSTKQREQKEMEKYGFTQKERDQYLTFKKYENAMAGQIENFLKVLDRYLPKREEHTYGGEFFTGKRPNFKKLSTKYPIKKYDVFQRRETKESTEAKLYVTLLIDNSGSMRGQKMEESLKTAIFFARVLKRFDIPFAVKFFGDQVVDIKDFDQDYDDARERIKPKLIQLGDASGGSTDISSPLEATEAEMAEAKRQYSGSLGAVFVISDGSANQGKTGGQLQAYIEKMQKSYMVNGFGLGSGVGEELKNYFGKDNTAAVDQFDELPNEAFRVLRVTLERSLKRLRKN